MREPVFNVKYESIDWSKAFRLSVSKEQGEQLTLARVRAMQQVFVGDPGYTIVFDREDEWDICCVLDACRYDTFKEVNELKGELELIISPGYNSRSWMEKTFVAPHSNLVVVTDDPWFPKIVGKEYCKKQIYHYRPVWKTCWNEELRTVMPELVTDEALDEHATYPDKKMLVHYMQPHDPFIANPDLSIKAESVQWKFEIERDRYTYADMYEFYKNNLRLVLKSVERLAEQTSDRIVITGDHGDGFGECGVAWGHAGGHMPWLVQVPWFGVEAR